MTNLPKLKRLFAHGMFYVNAVQLAVILMLLPFVLAHAATTGDGYFVEEMSACLVNICVSTGAMLVLVEAGV